MGAKATGLLHPGGHADRRVLRQAVAVCIPTLVLCLICWRFVCSDSSHQLVAQVPSAIQPAHAHTRPVLAPLVTTPAAAQPFDLSTQTREWFLTHPSNHCARHQLPVDGHVSQSPFASEDTFRSMADHTFDDYSETPGDTWNSSHVKPCDIIYVKTDLMLKFFQTRHTKINVTYILLSGSSAYSVPFADGDSKNPCQKDSCSRYLKDPQLGHWYGKNMLPGYGPKTTPLPLGLASERWPHGKSGKVLQIAQSAPAWEDRKTSVHVAMLMNTYRDRKKVAKHMASLPGALSVKGRVDYDTYLQQVANSKFVAAPRGRGIDTHRAWEAIYLGAVPIIQRSKLDWLYEGLPVLMVDDFANVTSSLLENYAATSSSIHYNTERAWAIYWHQELQRMQRTLCNRAA